MDTSRLRRGDTLTINKRGRKFVARFEYRQGRTLHVTPLTRGINYYTATAREVTSAKRSTWDPASALRNGGP